ncbi:MAG: hypothetical protein GY953_50460 [bacterium]|nr:hypothetical protein [bacterium]
MSLYWQATLLEAGASEPESTELTYQRLKMLRSRPGAAATDSSALAFAAVLV